ncbi:MAG: ParB N-terminal domain-containing protein [Syntrophales bacterium]|nr:ParB N-terminal domain-containing protein [Syntrophales bacterium]
MTDAIAAFDIFTPPLSMKKQDLSYFALNELRQATENCLLYDKFCPHTDADDQKLYWSIKANGILEPLHVSADGYILSGHRRYAAASWLGLTVVPCLVADDIIWGDLCADDRLGVLALYNKQRSKSQAELLREAMQEVKPDEAYQNLLQDRIGRRQVSIDDNVHLGECKRRARITTRAFLQAAQRAIESEKEYWPLTVRRVHYLLLNNPPLRHDKKPGSTYRNDLASYKALTNLLLRARLTGEIPFNAIEDETRPIRVIRTYQNAADFVRDEAQDFFRGYARDLLRGQKNHIEILVEKNAIRKHVEAVADDYCISCTTGRGYASLTPRLKMAQRFLHSDKERLILLILSDFDPDGEEIAASFPRSLRDDFGLQYVIASKVALSGDDVKEYDLPSDMEAKTSSPNYRKFVERHGIHVAELDAAPVELLQDKLRDAIESCLDMELFRAEIEKEKEDAVFIAARKKIILEALKECVC